VRQASVKREYSEKKVRAKWVIMVKVNERQGGMMREQKRFGATLLWCFGL